jgi:outer membrane protein OmpA-like peptidoglycan-associated protein
VRRLTTILAIVLFLVIISYSGVRLHQHLTATDRKISELTRQVTKAMETTKLEAAAATAATQKATEAAARAEIAAGARVNAEQQRNEALSAQAQAESKAQQALEQATQSKTELDVLKKQREQELNDMQQALSRVVETTRTANGMVMVLPDSTFKFDFDSAELKPRNRELLSRIVGILLASKGFGLSVFGYTDDIGTIEYNQKLSQRRAEAVRDYLVKAGIDASLINAKGFGKTNPRVSQETEQARATNRRVEIAVTNSEINYTTGSDH